MNYNSPPAAAPFVGPSKQQVLDLLNSAQAKRELPITLGSGSPKAVISFDDGEWSLKPLVINEQKRIRIQKEQVEYYLPEHEFAALELGTALVSDRDKKVFIQKLESMSWDEYTN